MMSARSGDVRTNKVSGIADAQPATIRFTTSAHFPPVVTNDPGVDGLFARAAGYNKAHGKNSDHSPAKPTVTVRQ